MHLPKLPTIFVKGGEERKAYFTVQARELVQAGWVEKKEEEVKPTKKEEAIKEEPKAEAKPRVTRVKPEVKKEEEDA
jgi:hypothetical protein